MFRCIATQSIVTHHEPVMIYMPLTHTEFKEGIGMLYLQQSLDSSVGRAEDCKGKNADILRSLVQIRSEGDFFLTPARMISVFLNVKISLEKVRRI